MKKAVFMWLIVGVTCLTAFSPYLAARHFKSINASSTPKFFLRGWFHYMSHDDKPTVELRFSDCLGPVTKNHFQVSLVKTRDPMKTVTKNMPVPFFIENFGSRRVLCLVIDQKVNFIDTYRVRVGEGIKNRYGEILRKHTEIEFEVHANKLNPRYQWDVSGAEAMLRLNNIKHLEYTLFHFNHDLPTHLRNYFSSASPIDGSWYDHRGFYPGLLMDQDRLDHIVRRKKIMTFNPGHFGAEELQVQLEKEFGVENGYFGVMVNKAVPAITTGNIAFYNYLKQAPFPLYIVHRNTMDFVLKTDGKKSLVWCYPKGESQLPGKIEVWLNNGRTYCLPAGRDGDLFRLDTVIKRGDMVMTVDPDHNNTAFCLVGNPRTGFREETVIIPYTPARGTPEGKVFTDRDIYLPGDTIHIAGIIKFYKEFKIDEKACHLPGTPGLPLILIIKGPDKKQLRQVETHLDHWGGFHFPLKTGKDFKKGIYSIDAFVQEAPNNHYCHSVKLDYFQPNQQEVIIRGLEEKYVGPRIPGCMVTGSFLSGNPMAGEMLEYNIKPIPVSTVVNRFVNPLVQSFSFTLDRVFKKKCPEITLQRKKRLDKNGTYRLKKEFKPLKNTHYPTALNLEAIGVTVEGKEYKTSQNTLYLPGNKLTGIKINETNDFHFAIEADLAVIDSNGCLTSARADVSIFKQENQQGKEKLTLIQYSREKILKNFDKFVFIVREKGSYFIKIDTYDDNGRQTSTSACFNAEYSASLQQDRELTIQAEKTCCETGEQAALIIYSPFKGKALVTLEQDHILDSFPLDINYNTPVTFKIKESYFPGFKMKVLAREGTGRFIEKAVDFVVTRPEDRPLQVFIEPVPDELPPSANANIKLKVTDHKGRGVMANLLVYAVDSGQLSLTSYQVPEMHSHFYQRKWNWAEHKKMTFYSRDSQTSFIINHPLLDIDRNGIFLFGRVVAPDGTGLPGVSLSISNKAGKTRATVTSPNGYFGFPGDSSDIEWLKLEREGYVTYIYKYCCGYPLPGQLVMLPLKKGEKTRVEMITGFYDESGFSEGVVGGVLGAPGTGDFQSSAILIPESNTMSQFRTNFQPVLFFKTIRTDAEGRGEVAFQTSDLLTTYRVMAVAYNGNNFGRGQGTITVSSEVLIKDAVPEFVHTDDTFTAGAVISNSTSKPVSALVAADADNIEITGKKQLKRRLKGLHNHLALFRFRAAKAGSAHIRFSLDTGKYRDGVIKKIPVKSHWFDEGEIYYDTGRQIERTLLLKRGYKKPVLELTVSPSIKRWTAKMSKVILSYPYGCMEQRTSKILPFLVLDSRLLRQVKANLTRQDIEKPVYEYLDRAELCIAPNGGMTYYGDGEPSQYLTVYVLWAFQLARQKGYKVNPRMIERMTAYLGSAGLSPDKQCLFQFVKSTVKQAEPAVLLQLYEQRSQLSLMGKVFLYKALHYQLHDGIKTGTLLEEFNRGLQTKDEEAWFQPDNTAYNRDLPFYNQRYLGALILQAVLEVEGQYPYANHIMNRLVKVESYRWETTQANFWIIYALGQFMQSQGGKTVDIQVGQECFRKVFAEGSADFYVEKSLSGSASEIPVKIVADGDVYVIMQLNYRTDKPAADSRGIKVVRHIYDRRGNIVHWLQKNEIYQVEILVDADENVPYGVIAAPIPGGVQWLREDHATTRELKAFNSDNEADYFVPWLQEEHEPDRTVFYSYELKKKTRVVFFVKALYEGTFNWMPTVVQGMYHPELYGRTAGTYITINPKARRHGE